MSNNELNSGQINDLLELIENKLVASSDGTPSPHLIAPTELAILITSSYGNHEMTNYRKQLLQINIEDDLVSGRKLFVASVAWISLSGHGHWVAYVVNPTSSYIAYGDSLGRPITPTLLVALRWWLLVIRKRMNLSTNDAVAIRPLLVTPQDDSFSCGILLTNAIGHHLLHDAFPLVGRDPISIKTYHIERTIDILVLDAEFVRVE